jgi:hypothetical protein
MILECVLEYFVKGDGTSVAVLHLYDSFHQKCSKLGTVATLGSKIRDGNENLKNVFLMPFQGPSKYTFFTKFKRSTALRN